MRDHPNGAERSEVSNLRQSVLVTHIGVRDRMTRGTRALLIVTSASVVGAAYFLYLTAKPFPPDFVRLVPIAWLVGSLLGGVLAARALKPNGTRLAAGLALALAIPSSVFAAAFSLAALVGD